MLRVVTKEMVVDFRRDRHPPSPLHIGGAAVEIVSSYKDPNHPTHTLFAERVWARRLRSIGSRTTRLRNSFYPKTVEFRWSPLSPPAASHHRQHNLTCTMVQKHFLFNTIYLILRLFFTYIYIYCFIHKVVFFF